MEAYGGHVQISEDAFLSHDGCHGTEKQNYMLQKEKKRGFLRIAVSWLFFEGLRIRADLLIL
jgi:hypothetical protein